MRGLFDLKRDAAHGDALLTWTLDTKDWDFLSCTNEKNDNKMQILASGSQKRGPLLLFQLISHLFPSFSFHLDSGTSDLQLC